MRADQACKVTPSLAAAFWLIAADSDVHCYGTKIIDIEACSFLAQSFFRIVGANGLGGLGRSDRDGDDADGEDYQPGGTDIDEDEDNIRDLVVQSSFGKAAFYEVVEAIDGLRQDHVENGQGSAARQ